MQRSRIGNGSTPSRENADYWFEGHYPWLNSSVVNLETVTEAEQFVTDTALRECHLPRVLPPAILVGITGEGKTRGMATTLLVEATINQHLAYIKPKPDRSDVYYLRRVVDVAYGFLRDESDGGGSTKGAITCEQLNNLAIPLPPMSEQREIVRVLETHNSLIAGLIAKCETAVASLASYRSALITAAVTGQIDVRNYRAEVSA
jgi:type I restriction enzyme S subunit